MTDRSRQNWPEETFNDLDTFHADEMHHGTTINELMELDTITNIQPPREDVGFQGVVDALRAAFGDRREAR